MIENAKEFFILIFSKRADKIKIYILNFNLSLLSLFRAKTSREKSAHKPAIPDFEKEIFSWQRQ
jgi:hypothetical protein